MRGVHDIVSVRMLLMAAQACRGIGRLKVKDMQLPTVKGILEKDGVHPMVDRNEKGRAI